MFEDRDIDMGPIEDWDLDMGLEDPEIGEISEQFLEGYERSIHQQARVMAVLHSDKPWKVLGAQVPALSRYYEGKTGEELEAMNSLVATAVGTAFAIRHALQSQQ